MSQVIELTVNGKQCQVAVELVVSDGEVTAPVGGRLYLPEKWANDLPRRRKAGVPEAVSFQTKPQIAGDLIAEALADGVTAAPILGDSVYGNAPELRERIGALGGTAEITGAPGAGVRVRLEIPLTATGT